MAARLLTALLLLAVPAALALATPSAAAVIKLEDGTRLQAQEFPGASKLSALQHLWDTAEVVVECPGHKDFVVYTGPSIQAVHAAYDAKQRAWCGLDYWLGNSAACRASVPPFGATAVLVAKPKGWFEQGGAAAPCTLRRVAGFSMPRFLLSLVGTFLFVQAPLLSASTPFRLTGGTLGFMALSLLVALFIIYRKLPRKKTLAAGTVLFGGSFLGAMKYLFGAWIPSWGQLLSHPAVYVYFGLSGLLGLALTYWYNNPENEKVNTMLNVALHLVGMGMAAAGPSLPEASALWVLSLLAYRLYSLLGRYRTVGGVFRKAKQAAEEMAAVDGERPTYRLTAAPAGPRVTAAPVPAPRQQLQPQPAAVSAAAKAPRRLWGFGSSSSAAGGGRAAVPAGAVAAAAEGEGEEGAGGFTPVLATARGGPAGDAVAAIERGTPVTAAPAAPEVSPLVQRGLVLNEETGHLIHIGKATYNRLVASGYAVDRAKGVITPPPPAPGSLGASPRGSGRGGARRRRGSLG